MSNAPQRWSRHPFAHGLGLALLAALAAGIVTPTVHGRQIGPIGLVASRNVNMVSGRELPSGDPYLQRQNEPSVAASTRNPLHLLAGANDYRTVDIPGNFDDGETGDAWLGLFKSFDGGERWQSTMLPGYPQDTSAEGMSSPLKAYHAGADPVVRPGTNGLLYYAGLAFNRGVGAPSAIFVSRFVDNNNKENGDPIAYISTSIIASSTGASFLDKPWLAVDVPRTGAKVCKISTFQPAPALLPGAKKSKKPKPSTPANPPAKGGNPPQKGGNPQPQGPKTISQQILAGTMYVSYASITTTTTVTGSTVESRIMFSRSEDCGASWSKPVQISDPADKVNQGGTIAIDPATGGVHVAWRQFGLSADAPDAMMAVSSAGAGKTFNKPRKVHQFPTGRRPDQLLPKLQRGHRMGDVHELVSIKPFDSVTAEDRFRTNAYPTMAIDDENRVYLAWTERGFGSARPESDIGDARIVIATSRNGGLWTTPKPVDNTALPGHQMMPSMAFAAGKLVMVYYDLRQDVSQEFGPFVDENDAVLSSNKRHTIDVRAVQANRGDVPVFGASTLVSQYLVGNLKGSNQVRQLQYNAPNLPLFQLGSVPFMGDYIDLAPAPAFVQRSGGAWVFNTAATTAPVFHAVWTDNRDVQKPADGNWKNYTPPGGPGCMSGQTGMRNQNVYSARLTMGLVAGSPGNTKPLDPTVPRSFVVFAQNTSSEIKSFRLSLSGQPPGGNASFDQIGTADAPPLLTSIDVTVAARSMVTRTVYITSTDPKATVPVDIAEIEAPEASLPKPGGLATRVVLNPDISNPDISNPDISNPDISNPDISNAEVYNPDISNPDISNPDISNPDISNPDISNPDISNVVIANPDISNPDISNPDISNPDISNPDISNPDISNPDISNGSLTDVTWTITNTGNTTASFNVTLFLANAAAKVGGVKTQMIVHKTYTTPVASGCELKYQTQTVLVANVLNPKFEEPGTSSPFDPSNPDISNTTLWLEPGGEGKITLRIVDPNTTDNIEINPVEDVTPVVEAEPTNTPDLNDPTPEPPSTTPPTPAEADVALAFVFGSEPSNTVVDIAMAPITVLALADGLPQAGVQVTLAIAVNPAAGHLNGTTTLLSDGSGHATFSGLFIERAGAGYRLSASASAAGAVPVLSAPFDIERATPVATATGGGPFVYDAQAHGGTCAVTGVGAAVLPGTLTYSSGGAPVDVGVHTVTCAFAGDEYYGPASDEATITITARAATVTAGDGTKVYGTTDPALSDIAATFLMADAAGITLAQSRVAGETVGTYATTATATGGNVGNYAVTYVAGEFTITTASSATTTTGGAFVYDGTPKTSTCTVTGANEVSLATGTVTYTPPGDATAPVDVGIYVVNCAFTGDANHAGSSGVATITITARAATVTAGDGTKVYGTMPDPALSDIAATFLMADAAGITLAQSRAAGETVGNYATTATATGGNVANYAVTYVAGEFTITKASSETTTTGGAFVYDGTPKASTCSVTGANGVSLAGTVTYTPGEAAAPVDVGTYEVSCEFVGDANHTGSSGAATITITARAATVTAGDGTKVYGTMPDPALSDIAATFLMADTAGITLAQSRAAGETVGNYAVTATATGGNVGNYAVTYVAGEFTITSASSETTTTGGEFVYDATPKASVCTVTGANGVSLVGTVTYTPGDAAAPVDVGTYGVSCEFAGDANHTGSSGPATITITPATPVATATGGSFVYDGQPHGGSCAVIGVNSEVLTGTLSYNPGSTAPVNVGLYTVTCARAAGGNYIAATDDETIEITPATPVATATGGTFTYDGQPHPGSCLVTGVNQAVLNGSLSYSSDGAPVNVGTYTVTCAFVAAGNYTAASDDDTITIELPPNPYTVVSTADTFTPGTLRYAMTAANITPGPNTINFAIPGAGPFTITLTSPLPTITSPVTIDATGQPGYDLKPWVAVHAGATTGRGFELTAPSTIRGLMIQGFDGAGGHGVLVQTGASGSVVEDNIIGTDLIGAAGLGNDHGVLSLNADNVIVRGNTLSGNNKAGVVIAGGADAVVQDNRIGTTPDGLAARPNANGVVIDEAALNPTVRANLISGNNDRGIDVRSNAGPVTGVKIVGNTIGLASNGTTALPNRVGGVRLTGTEGAVIGAPSGGRNVISGNGVPDNTTSGTPALDCDLLFQGPGIDVVGASTVMPVIQSNYIGTNEAGDAAVPNLNPGVSLTTPAKVGGSGPGEGNVISGNGCGTQGPGIVIGTAASGSVVQGNIIGLAANGADPLGNGGTGVLVSAAFGAVIGGTAPGAGNVISSNDRGIGVEWPDALLPWPTGVVIQGNYIGTDATGLLMRGNTYYGIHVGRAENVSIGGLGPGAANLIANNGSAGVMVVNASATGISMYSNRIFGNGGLGIDLDAVGVNANDTNDTDGGANGLQNFPVLSNAVNSPGPTTKVDFTLNSGASQAYNIQVFASPSCDGSGNGEGERLVGVFAAATAGSGNTSGSITLSELVPVGQVLTATATHFPGGNTSEFSGCVPVQQSLAVITSVTPVNGKPGEGFLVVRGVNLPAGLGDSIAVVVSGATTGNGFVFLSPSSATAVWVRLPFGQPLGAGTIQLRNAAGTIVSNAFPITITALPGTPVITGVYNDLGQVIAAPIDAGTTVLVGADGIDTTDAVVRFVQGATTWDIVSAMAVSSPAIGVTASVSVPAAALGGPISISIRQGASAFSTAVSITLNAPPASPFVVTNTTDGGLGSLRFAITTANANADANTITFAIPGAGPHTIAPVSPLPNVTAPVVIDATTQPGWDGKPMVRVHGAATATRGFELQSPSTIKGLAITGFIADAGVLIMAGGAGSVVWSSHLGTDRLGAAGLGNGLGVKFNYTSSAVLFSSLISGNAIDGVLVVGGNANEIRANFIGTGLSGFGALPNGDNGITLYDGANGTLITGNVISGNGAIPAADPGWGIDIQQSGALANVTNTRIEGNYIGLDANGNIISRGGADYVGPGPGFVNFGPVNRGNAGGGIRVNRGSGTMIGNELALPNAISGNTGHGVLLMGSTAVTPVLKNNFIGTDPGGTTARGNGGRGVEVSLSSAVIGQPGADKRNVISGNIRDGVFSDGNTRIENNKIGTNAVGTVAIGNGMLDDGGVPFSPGCCHTGIFVVAVGASANVVTGNLVSGNRIAGIRSGGALGAWPNAISGNKVGTNAAGTGAIPNGEGIGLYGDKSGTTVTANLVAFNTGAAVRLVEGTVGATIGGLPVGDGNTIRNNGAAVQVGYNAAATGDVNNRILSNVITDSGLAIDLGSDGQTANDGVSGSYDADTGPNNLQNAPLINSAENSTTTMVDFSPNTSAGSYTFQFFSGSSCTGAEAVVKTTTGVISGTFEHRVEDLGVLLPVGTRIFMTATDNSGNTSEFKSCVTVTAPPPPAPPTFVGSAGGGGGSPFGPIMCPAGSVATAFRGRAGDDIDRTELWCSPVLAGPSLGAAAFAGGVGGFGGSDYGATLTCPAGSVMTGIHGRAGIVLWGGNVVDTLGVTCTNLSTSAVYTSPTVGNATPAGLFAINCAAGQEVMGINGGQGGLLDRIGIYCGQAAAPSPSPLAPDPPSPALEQFFDRLDQPLAGQVAEEDRRRFAPSREAALEF